MSPQQHLYDALRARLRGYGDASAAAGLVLPGLRGVAQPLDGGPLSLWLAPSAQAPQQWRCSGVDVGLEAVRAPRWRVQAATVERVAHAEAGFGTVGALVRDRLDADNHFILTCGHVLAGTRQVRHGDPVRVAVGDAASGTATLLDWEPALGDAVVSTGLDAAIARIDGALVQALMAEPLPRGVSDSFWFDQPVLLRTASPKRGRLKTRWSGYVDVPGNDADIDYFLDDAIGYEAEPATQGGDSGAAVWDEATQTLLGIHVAAPADDERWRSNAALCPIRRIMDWFDVEPVLDAVAQPPLVALAPPTRVAPAGDAAIVQVVAQTLWGEARGESERGMRAVACVIEERRRRRWMKATNAAEVCLAPFQFGCWNRNDPNRARMEAIARQPDAAYTLATAIAQELVAGELVDITDRATHYYAASMPAPPGWARGKRPCATVGHHLFFNDIR